MMRRLMPMLAIVLIFIGIYAFYQLAAVRTRAGADAPLYSTRRYDPYGTAAIRDLLMERGIPVQTLERPNLHADDHGVLIQVLDSAGDRMNPSQLLAWISKGNTVIQYSRAYTRLMGQLKIKATTQPFQSEFADIEQFQRDGVPPDQADFDATTAKIIFPAGWELSMWQPMRLNPPATNPFWKTLARSTNRRPGVVAAQIRIGKGKLIVVCAPEPALNGMLGSANNLDFLLSIVGNGPVILDEWSHGLGKEPTIMGLIHEVGLFPLLFQIAGIVLLYIWSTAGYARRDYHQNRRRRSSAEQIQTLGYLYERSFNSEITRQRIDTEVRRRLSSALRCSPQDLPVSLKNVSNEIRDKTQRLLSQLETLHEEKSFAQALTTSHELQREVQRERRFTR